MVCGIIRHGVIRGTTVASRRSAAGCSRPPTIPSQSIHHDTAIASRVVSAVPSADKTIHCPTDADVAPHNDAATQTKSPEALYLEQHCPDEATTPAWRFNGIDVHFVPGAKQPRGRNGPSQKHPTDKDAAKPDKQEQHQHQQHQQQRQDARPAAHADPSSQQHALLSDQGSHSLSLPRPHVVRVDGLRDPDVKLPRRIDYVLSEQRLQHLIDRCRLSTVIYLDAEGESLSRHGTIDVLTIWTQELDAIHVIPVHIFGDKVFSMRSKGRLGRAQKHASLRQMFRDPSVCKVAWDVRGDANALYWHYNVRFENMLDLQLLEAATRSKGRPKKHAESKSAMRLYGLGRAVRDHTPLAGSLKERFYQQKHAGRASFDPAAGGCPDAFRHRFLTRQLLEYAGTDVRFLRLLELIYRARPRCTPDVADIVREASAKRMRSALLADFCYGGPTIQGRHPAANPFYKAYDPHFWQHGSRLDQIINRVRTSVLHVVAWWRWRARSVSRVIST